MGADDAPRRTGEVDEPMPPTEPARAEPGVETGRHATVRPDPVPPPPAPVRASTRVTPPAPVDGTAWVRPTTIEQTAVEQTTAEPTTVQPAGATTGETPAPEQRAPEQPSAARTTTSAGREPTDDGLFPAPNAPRSTAVGTHVLGALVGLVLAPVAAAVLLLGQSRILAVQVVGWDATVDWSGVVLVALALLALGWVALLAVWTPAAPLTGGVVLTALGALALVAPGVVHTRVLSALGTSAWRTTALEVTVTGTSGTLLVAGFLLLLAGVVAIAAHRRGLTLGAFRERHR